jgi:glycosyltransferase involved in cell wall biosynthesis
MGYATEPNAQDIAQAIADYYDNQRQVAFTDYLREEKKKYDWNKMTQTIRDIYEQIK